MSLPLPFDSPFPLDGEYYSPSSDECDEGPLNLTSSFQRPQHQPIPVMTPEEIHELPVALSMGAV